MNININTLNESISANVARMFSYPEYVTKTVFWIFAAVLGAVTAYTKRFNVGADGISYLDIAKSYSEGRWSEAVNALWSPLYSWLIAIGFWAIQPPVAYEAALAQLVNYLCFLFQLICFSIFLSTLLRGSSNILRNNWVRICAGCLFLWSNTVLSSFHRLGPDSLAAALIFVALTLILNIQNGRDNWRTFIALGVVLGLAYYAKSPMFPLGCVYLVYAGTIAANKRGVLNRLVGGFAVFFLLCSPFIIALSVKEGHLTFSEAGRINYLWRVNGVPDSHFQGDAVHGWPLHPTRRIYETPPVLEFGSPISATYPVWYDPIYWYKGVNPVFDLDQQITAFRRNCAVLIGIFNGILGLTMIALLLSLAFGQGTDGARSSIRNLPVLFLCLFSICTYLIIHLEPRYITAFLIAIVAVLSFSLDMRSSKRSFAIAAAIILPTLLSIGAKQIGNVRAEMDKRNFGAGPETIRILPGERLGIVFSEAANAAWVRAAGARIIAEVDTGDRDLFWNLPNAHRTGVMNAFEGAGVDVVVSSAPPESADAVGWEELFDTPFFAKRLSK
jgi:hypothetical protein